MQDEILIEKLRNCYEKAGRNESTLQIHLFSIKYSQDIRNSKYTISELATKAGLTSGYATEISKGIKLAPYVKEREDKNMNKNTVYAVKEYLEQRGIIKISDEITPMDLRREGKEFSLEEHLQGMIYSLMSAQAVWANIERNKSNIDNIFFNYDINEIKKRDYMYFVNRLGDIRCRSRLTNNQMKALQTNIATLERIISNYGSMDAFVTSAPTDIIVDLISNPKSKYKIKQMGEALAREYLRNVGIDSAKPDIHMKRILGSERLAVSKYTEATNEEVITTMKKLSKETGLWMSQIDYIFWAYCATDMGEICTANPRCEKCVIRNICKKCL